MARNYTGIKLSELNFYRNCLVTLFKIIQYYKDETDSKYTVKNSRKKIPSPQ